MKINKKIIDGTTKLIQNGRENNISFNITLNKNENEKEIEANFDIDYNETKVSLNYNGKTNYNSNINIESLTKDNSIKLNDFNEEQLEQLFKNVNRNIQTEVPNRINELGLENLLEDSASRIPEDEDYFEYSEY